MPIITEKFNIMTKGFTDIIDITTKIKDIAETHNIKEANANIYVAGSTASVTSIEFEPGLVKDLPEILESLVPMKKIYHHDETWHDGNGYAHIRASIIGNSVNVPVVEGHLQLGTWQQIVLVDFDNKPRTRTIICQFLY